MAASRVCSIEGCGKPLCARGLCNTHYAKAKRNSVTEICSIEGCDKPIFNGRGWCSAHYDRWRDHGDPLGGRPSGRQTCKIKGCGKLAFGHGLCPAHYWRWRRHGDPLGGGAPMDGRKQHPLHTIWTLMLGRCHSENYKTYHHYGGRGITVCDRWRNDFWAFVKDVGPRPSSKFTLGRIDNNKGYEPGNVEWQTYAQQHRNHRRNIFITIDGRTQVVQDWAVEKGIPAPTIYGRLVRGWSKHDAVMTPPEEWRELGQKRKGKCPEIFGIYQQRYKLKHPTKKQAHTIVSSAIKKGHLIPQPCQICGKIAQAHHEDYSKPLSVEWLCSKHHKAIHRKNS